METIGAALDLLAEIPADRKIVVLGEMTEPPVPQGPAFRRQGERVAEVAAQAIFMGSSKICSLYGAGARKGGMNDDSISRGRHDIDLAVSLLPSDLGSGDVILVKGARRQRLERLSFRLMGRAVECRLKTCSLPVACEHCPHLLTGTGAAEPTTPKA